MRNFLLMTILFVFAACNQKLKHKVGLSTTGPDEYKVQRANPLEVPPHFELKEPTNNN